MGGPATLHPVYDVVTVMAVHVAPTAGVVPTVPVEVEPVQLVPAVVTVAVNVPPVAVNAVSPALCQVTAPETEGSVANDEHNAAARTRRVILLMSISSLEMSA